MNTTPTILAVDDEPAALMVLVSVLSMAESYRVVTATNVDDAIQIAGRELPDLVITDRYMPGRDGFDLCRWIKGHPALADTMVMLVTASSDISSVVKGLDIGADDYIAKPFHPDELHSRIRALLRIKRLGDQLKDDNSRLEELNAALRENLAGVMDLITHVIELRVPDASVRAEKACEIARWMGKRFDLDTEVLEALVIASRIHEIGKITMPDDVLARASEELAVEQRETLVQYPMFGQMLVGRIPQLKEIGTIIRHQLENFDGTGWPDHLLGDQIPIASRILRVITVVEQAGRGATEERMLERIGRGRGTELDPVVAQAAVEYVTTQSDPEWRKGKHQVAIGMLQQGMTIVTDISTAMGIKLLPGGTKLSASHISRIQAHNLTDPILCGVYVIDEASPSFGS